MNEPARILVVEDGAGEREALVRMLRMEQFDVVSAPNPEKAMELIDLPIDLVISDLRMGRSSGLDLLRQWSDRYPHTPFLMLTAYGDVESAVAAMKLGARDYLTKPVNPNELLDLINKYLAQRAAAAPPSESESPADRTAIEKVVGRSQAMVDVCDQTLRAAQTESTVLILGESGTGKELIAEAIHENSPRTDGPFVLVNMAAIPETLVESELFGHVKGSFTGAVNDRIGRFEAANGGTLFIDEIGEFPAASQAKLLRVLENRTITPVGSNADRNVDVRVVAATSRNLRQMVAEARFREDLFYRLNVVAIHLPPLRERAEDIPLLVDYFLRELCRTNHKPNLKISPELMQRLTEFDWPGNVRQLRNCLESMVVMSTDDLLKPEDLPRSIVEAPYEAGEPVVTLAPDQTLEDLKRAAILQALQQFDGNRTRAAESLGISVRTLQRRLKDWNVSDEEIKTF